MAELGIAASVVQLIQFSGVVLTGCYTYISKAKNATKEIQQVINDVSGLEGILKQLHLLVSGGDNERHALLKLLGSSHGPLHGCSQALVDLQKRLDDLTQASSTRRKLLWPLEATKIQDILRRLGEQKQTFLLALAGDHAVSDDLNAKKANETVERVKDLQAENERAKYLSWLDGPDPWINYNAAREKNEKTTGKWLLESNEFRAWEKSEGQMMWLYGIPGAGKTILSSTVIDHLSSEYGARPGYMIAYFYFAFNDASKQTSSGCLRSLARQLCIHLEIVPAPIKSLYDASKARQPSNEELIAIIMDLVGNAKKVYIIIDALDECTEEEGNRERKALFFALSSLRSSTTNSPSMFVTSRPEIDIRVEMTRMGVSTLEAQGSGVQADIHAYIITFLSNDARMKTWPQDIKDAIVIDLSEKANGMFRWVACQLESLQKCLKPKLATIKKKLSDLPRTLDSTYERILRNLNKEYEREMRTVLLLLAFSSRPMTIQEVAEATAVNLSDKVFDVDERFPDPYDILELCSSLVSLVDLGSDINSGIRSETKVWDWPPEVKIVQFAHFSVKEFLLSEKGQSFLSPGLRFDAYTGHLEITEMCLIYILGFNGGQRAIVFDYLAYPLVAYAALYWTNHMTAVSANRASLIQDLFVRLFDPDNTDSLLNFLNLHNPSSVWDPYSRKELSFGHRPQRTKQGFETPLYYACHYGLLEIAQWLMEEEGLEPDAKKEKFGPPLSVAARAGHSDIVRMLLEEGADPNSPYCGDFYRPLHAAVMGNDVEIVKLLLEAGSDVNAFSIAEGTALHLAAKHDNPEVIQALIDAGHPIDINVDRGTPLFIAASNGKNVAVSVLVRNGADVNDSLGSPASPLVAAARYSNFESVKLMIDAGAKINVPGASATALYNAARKGDVEIMRFLIARGADVNALGGKHGTPLNAAIRSDELAPVQLMLDSGADIGSGASESTLPLDNAVRWRNLASAEILLDLGAPFGEATLVEALRPGQDHIVKILLDRGANPNAGHKEYGNAIQRATLKSTLEVVGWLLDAGADVNAVDGRYGTALQAACGGSSFEMVRLLLGRGSLVNASACGEYGHALQVAAADENEELVKILLDHGAEVNAVGGRHGTALQAAASCEGGRDVVLSILLEKGADPNIQDVASLHETALRAALVQGHEHIARLLLENGASPSLTSTPKELTPEFVPYYDSIGKQLCSEYSFESPLEIAAASGKPSLVQLLFDNGLAEVEGRTCVLALRRAAQNSDITILRSLIAKGLNVKQYGGPALVQAVDCRHEEHVTMLLDHGVEPNNFVTYTALELSIHHRQWDLMHKLIECGANVNLISSGYYGTALIAAVGTGTKDFVVELLNMGADINAQGGIWRTALIRTAVDGDQDLLELLLDHGADVNLNIKEPDGWTCGHNALEAAITCQYYEMANSLLDRGAVPNSPHCDTLARACAKGKPGQLDLIKRLVSMGCEPDHQSLAAAVIKGNMDVATLLLELGANVNGSTEGWNALHTAVDCRQLAMMKLLIEKGANVNTVCTGEHSTALHMAVWRESDAATNILLGAGADVNIEGGYYGSVLGNACRRGSVPHVKLLLGRGAKVNICAGHYANPLQIAAKSSQREASLEIVKILVEHGANINVTGGKYGNALQAACCYRRCYSDAGLDVQVQILQLLIEKGADVNAEGGKYGTALQAAVYHDIRYVEVLLKNNADPNAKGGKFGSPWKAAEAKNLKAHENKSYRTAKLLKQYGAIEEKE